MKSHFIKSILSGFSKRFSRRDFLKLCSFSAAGLAFAPFPRWGGEMSAGDLVRVAANYVNVYSAPSLDSDVEYRRNRDDLLHVYYDVQSEDTYNPLWYRVWCGYAHSTYLQPVKFMLNSPLAVVPQAGMLVEVTVPYTRAMRYKENSGWQPVYLLYYGSNHWVTAVMEGPDGEAWYRIVDSYSRQYYAAAYHLRPIPAQELAPISPDLPRPAKRIEVSISDQTLTAYEEENVVLQTRISSGMRQDEPPAEDEISTETPLGNFHITVKTPSRHMGNAELTTDMSSYPLPGVPWVCFFHETGVSLHGTYWHANFGSRVSHGCVNMRNEDARWIYRWSEPVVPPEERQLSDWGTRVVVY